MPNAGRRRLKSSEKKTDSPPEREANGEAKWSY
jgi:hypothetical protein